jgi:hypothetical protein
VPRSGTCDVTMILPFQASANTVRNTTEKLGSVTTQYITSNKVAQLHPAPSNNREALFNVTINDAREGAKGGWNRHKQHFQEAATVADDDGGNGKHAGSSGVVHLTASACSGKRQAQPPTDHFEKLLEETCSNHAYPIKHKLKDYVMIKNFMASESLTEA